MSQPPSLEAQALDHDDAPGADSGATTLFEGDTGELTECTRRALVQLLRGPSIDAHTKANLWAVVIRDERILRSRLHELFLELVVDTEDRVAFTRQLDPPELDVPRLLRSHPLTFLESALILHLRALLLQAQGSGERPVVSAAELIEHLSVYERGANTNRARFARQCEAAIERAKVLNVLRTLRGTESRYEVSPTLKLLFDAEQIAALAEAYARASAVPEAGDDEGAEDDALLAQAGGDNGEEGMQ